MPATRLAPGQGSGWGGRDGVGAPLCSCSLSSNPRLDEGSSSSSDCTVWEAVGLILTTCSCVVLVPAAQGTEWGVGPVVLDKPCSLTLKTSCISLLTSNSHL